MADTWPDVTPIPTVNFDQDSDDVTGVGGARDNLLDLVERINALLLTVDEGAKLYSDLNKGTLAFQDAPVTFTQAFKALSSVVVERDISSSEKLYTQYLYSGAQQWAQTVTSVATGKHLVFRNASNIEKFRVEQGAQAFKVGSSNVTFGGQTMQIAPVKKEFSSLYISATAYSLTHSQGRFPDLISINARCIAADQGYNVGQIINVSTQSLAYSDSGGNSNGSASGVQVTSLTSNTVKLQIGNYGIRVFIANSSLTGRLTNSRWYLDTTFRWF